MKPDRTWPPSHLDTVLFDLDDTLIDSFEARVAALERVFANFDIRGYSGSEFMRDLGGKQLMTALEELESELGRSNGLYETYREFYWTNENRYDSPLSRHRTTALRDKGAGPEYRLSHPKAPQLQYRRTKRRRDEGGQAGRTIRGVPRCDRNGRTSQDSNRIQRGFASR